jgi:hypothetical protein
MSERSIIQGWSITQGDYQRDPEYDDQFIRGKKNQVVFKKAVFSIGAVIAVGVFIGIMSVMTHLVQ